MDNRATHSGLGRQRQGVVRRAARTSAGRAALAAALQSVNEDLAMVGISLRLTEVRTLNHPRATFQLSCGGECAPRRSCEVWLNLTAQGVEITSEDPSIGRPFVRFNEDGSVAVTDLADILLAALEALACRPASPGQRGLH